MQSVQDNGTERVRAGRMEHSWKGYGEEKVQRSLSGVQSMRLSLSVKTFEGRQMGCICGCQHEWQSLGQSISSPC